MGELSDFYRAARAKFDSDPGVRRSRAAARRAAASRRRAHARAVAAARRSVEAVLLDGLRSGSAIGLRDEHVRGESAYNAALAEVAAELERKGLASINDGALCAFPPGFTNRDGEPLPLIVRKQDGGYGYGATDLAALRYRTQTLGGTRLLYVVGAPQAQHLCDGVRRRRAGRLAGAARARGARGVRLRARRRQEDVQVARRRYGAAHGSARRGRRARRRRARTAQPRRRRGRARARWRPQIGIGAVKYADLSNDRIKDYVFDWDRMLAAEGRTGPYLQYAHARIHSIFRRAAEQGVARTANAAISLREPAERKLALELLDFGNAVIEAGETLRPHRLCGYLYDLATAFTAFFENCPVLKAPDDATRASRLALCELTARALSRGLDLLGIAAPERM